MTITKRKAIEVTGSAAALAKLLGIRHQAVQQWPMDEPIPRLRQYQLRDLMPGVFERGADEDHTTEAMAA